MCTPPATGIPVILVLRIRHSSQDIMNLWKGDAPILATLRQGWSNYFEDATQFAPVFVDIANEENQTAEVVGASPCGQAS